MRRTAAMVAAVVIALASLLATPASATDVDLETLRRLAAAAADDPAALDELREVTAVDGIPFDAARLIDDASTSRDELLETIVDIDVGGDELTDRDPAAEADRILSQRKYQQASSAEDGSLSWLDRIFDFLARVLPEPLLGAGGWIVILGLVLFAAWAFPRYRRTLPQRSGGSGDEAGEPDDADAAALLAQAEDAAAAGDYAEAVRLRYAAGVFILTEKGVFRYPETVTTDALRSIAPAAAAGAFDRFDAIVYGGRTATSGDDDEAKHAWQAITEPVSR